MELPKNIYETSIEENISKGITVGVIKGLGMSFIRTGAGVYEMVTFFAPIPDGYEPVLNPETIFYNKFTNVMSLKLKGDINDY